MYKTQPFFRHHFVPVDAQGIGLNDICVRLQRQEVQRREDDVFRLFQHLALGNPEGSLANRNGEVIDLDSVELADTDLNRISGCLAEGDLTLQQTQCLVFQATEADVALREEIPAACGRVQELQ